MKYAVIVGDGMADEPLQELGGRTPLQAARTETMDRIAAEGVSGRFLGLVPGLPTSSDVANLAVLGYDPRTYYPGRGPIEAAARGVAMDRGDVAFRCNIVTAEGDRLIDYAGGRPSDEEAEALVAALNGEFSSEGAEFVVGLSYRHLLVLRGSRWSGAVRCEKPDDHPGEPYEPLLPRADGEGSAAAETAEMLRSWIVRSRTLLEAHPVNRARRREGRPLANLIWPYGGGGVPRVPSFESRFGVRGAVVAGVDVIFGIGVVTGMDPIRVEGATGYLDTNYEGKAEAALAALEDHDFVYVHVEAPDECSHQGDLAGKIRAIEDLDCRLLLPLWEGRPKDTRFLVLPDHPVPLTLRKHTREPVPFALCGPGVEPDGIRAYDEASATGGSAGLLRGEELMRTLFA